MNREFVAELEAYYAEEKRVIDEIDLRAVSDVMGVLEDARRRRARVFIFGNGGSAATASHFVCDFNKGVSLHRRQHYDFECLNDNSPTLMAISNDISYDDVFVLPLEGKMREGDVVVGISGSGNSENVVRALKYAKEHGGITVGLTGYDGGAVRRLVEYSVHVPVCNMQIVEDLHMTIDHAMMWVLSKDDDE